MEIKASLLSSLRLVLYFICVSVLSCLVFGIIYMLYNLCENMVAGQSLLFDMNLFLEGLFVVTPFVFMFGSLLMVLNLVRHPADSLAVMVVYGLISVCLWLLLIPRVVRADVLPPPRRAIRPIPCSTVRRTQAHALLPAAGPYAGPR